MAPKQPSNNSNRQAGPTGSVIVRSTGGVIPRVATLPPTGMRSVRSVPDTDRQTRSQTGNLPSSSRYANREPTQAIGEQEEIPLGEPAPISQEDNGNIGNPGTTPSLDTNTEQENIRRICEVENNDLGKRLDALEGRLTSLDIDNNGRERSEIENLRQDLEALRAARNEDSRAGIAEDSLAENVRLLRDDVNKLLEEKPESESSRRSADSSKEEPREPIILPSQRAHQRSQERIRSRAQASKGSRRSVAKSARNGAFTRSYNSGVRRKEVEYAETSSSEEAENFDEIDNFDENFGNSNPFFEREKGPKYPGLASLHTSDPLFDRHMSYRFYRLNDTTQTRTSSETGKVRRFIKDLEITLSEQKFTGADPILVFDFLVRFIEEMDTLGINEGQAFIILPYFLKGSAQRQYRASRNGSRSGGVSSWPEAIQYFIRTYATPTTLREAVDNLRNLRQERNETETEFSIRINEAAHRCGNVHAENEKMTFFVNGLLPEIQPRVIRFREEQPRYDLTFERLVQTARDEGNATRAQARPNLPRGNTNQRSKERPKHSQVQFVEHAQTPSYRSPSQHENVYMLEDGSIPTSLLPSTETTEATRTENEQETEDLFYTDQIQPPHIAYGGPNATRERVGWRNYNPANKQLIYHVCYAIGHISTKCNHPLNAIDKVVLNYEKLNPDQKSRVPNRSYNSAVEYLKLMKAAREAQHGEQSDPNNNPQSKN